MILYPSITVDLYKPYPLVILEVPQYNIGRGALVTLTAGGAAVVPTDEIIETYALKPDGTKVYNTSIMAGNQVQINFSEQMTAVDGILQCELQMIDALGHSITTPIFAVRILPSNIDAEAITSSDDFQALVDALAQVQGFDQVKQSIGTLSELTTTAKDNLVAAINEVDGDIGDLSGLTTTAKNNLVAALNELNQKTIYRDYTYEPATYPSQTITQSPCYKSLTAISGYIPTRAIVYSATEEGYAGWFTVDVSSAPNIIIRNNFSESLECGLTVRVIYEKL